MKPATLRCTACGRALTVAYVSIQTKAGALSYGPVCGRSLKVADNIYRAPAVTRERVLVATRRRKAHPSHDEQLELPLAVETA